MKTIKLNTLNKDILLCLKAYPAGLSTTTLAKYIKADYFVVYQRLLRLKSAGYIAAKDKFWKIEAAGQNWLFNVLNAPSQLSTTATVKSQNVKDLTELPPKRLNGMRIYFRVYRTEHERLEAKLTAAGIEYATEKARHYLQYIINWQGYKLRFTTRTLVVYVPEEYKGFEIEGKAMVNDAADKACRAIVALLAKLPIRMQEENGKLWHKIAYFEIAHTQSAAAKAIMKQIKRVNTVPLAFDRMTGRRCTWADNSYNLSELEFDKLTPEALNANLQQDLKDGKWNHRTEQQKLREVAELQTQVLNAVKGLATAQAAIVQVQDGQQGAQNAISDNMARIMQMLAIALQAQQERQKPKRWEFT